MKRAAQIVSLVCGAAFLLLALNCQHSSREQALKKQEEAASPLPPAASAPRTLTPVRVRLKWKHQAQFAGFYVAKEKKYFEQAGLDVRLDPGGPDANALQIVLEDNADFGIWGAEQILLNYKRGVRAVGVIYQRTAACWMVRADSGIRSFHDFVGKRVGVQQGTDIDVLYSTLARKAGVDRSKINEKVVGFNLALFLTGDFDVWPSYAINEPFLARENKVDVRCLYPHEFGLDFYGDTIFARDDYLKANPEVVRAFLKASEKGWTDALADPTAAAEITLKQEPILKRDHQVYMLKESAALVRPSPSAKIFEMTPERWQAIADALKTEGVLTDDVDVRAVFTNEFLPNG